MLSGALVFSGCQDTVDSDHPSLPLKEGEAEVHITLNISGQMQTALRAIGQTEEKALHRDSISVLAFDAANDTLLYKANITVDGTKIVTVVKPDIAQQFVVIANFDTTNIIQNFNIHNKSDLTNLIAGNNGKWNAEGIADFRRFPMWGESGIVTIAQTQKGAYKDTINLLRMVARIDVDASASATAATFSLDVVWLYNTNTTGQVVPDSVVKNVSNKDSVTTASIPAGVTKNLIPIDYSPTSTNKIEGAIYTFETAGSPLGGNSHADATCLVIGGRYSGGATTTYYRVDFVDSVNHKYRDILRNHQYKVKIIAVNGPGYDTKDQAFAAKSASIEADVLNWDDTGDPNDDVVMNDQYFLAVTQNSFKFSKEALDSAAVTIKTNFPDGWKITSIKDPSGTDVTWLNSLTSAGDSSTTGGRVWRFHVDSYQAGVTTDPTDIRTAEITVKAGRLTRKIIVQQANVDSVKIEFEVTIPSGGIGIHTWGNDTLKVVNPLLNSNLPVVTVRWDPKTIGSSNNSILVWLTPASVDLQYAASFSFGVSLVGVWTRAYPDPNGPMGYGPIGSSPEGLHLRAQVSNGFITVEKYIVVIFVP
ncbi:hypothetical protein AGMMS49982_01690 [Bacteroidia bacterium]|nr:hypothetical protein AGMMS49982_01690 [Bacteroidia bacterium]